MVSARILAAGCLLGLLNRSDQPYRGINLIPLRRIKLRGENISKIIPALNLNIESQYPSLGALSDAEHGSGVLEVRPKESRSSPRSCGFAALLQPEIDAASGRCAQDGAKNPGSSGDPYINGVRPDVRNVYQRFVHIQRMA